MATTESPHTPSVTRSVIQRQRIAISRNCRKVRRIGPGSSECETLGFLRTQTPSNGENTTATTHDANSAIATTAKIEKVYSPAALWAKPIGTNPATVTSVPLSMGKAVEV